MFDPKGNSTREAAIIVCIRTYELYRRGDGSTV